LGESCWLCAINTNSSQFINFLGKWDQIDNIPERLSLESTVKSCDNDNYSLVGQTFSEVDNILKELTFVDSNDIIFHGLVFNIVQF
jgi:hypothetical protein